VRSRAGDGALVRGLDHLGRAVFGGDRNAIARMVYQRAAGARRPLPSRPSHARRADPACDPSPTAIADEVLCFGGIVEILLSCAIRP
jgi:hypothetical protein